MAPSFDCAASSLLCAEDISFSADEFENGDMIEDFETNWHHRNNRTNNRNKESDDEELLTVLPMLTDECLALMVKGECEHLLPRDYLNRLRNGDFDLGARKEAVEWIGKVVAYFNFGPLCAYLSVIYLDRFLSLYELPKGKAWMMQLLAVACLSIAAKMEETNVPLSLDLQVGESKFVFESRTIQRMELMVMSTLKWRMKSVTPFSFIDSFLQKINGDKILRRSSIFLSTQILLSTIKGIEFLEFRPSEVAAAAAAISVAGESETMDIEKSVFHLIKHVEEERVLKCVERIHETSLISGTVKVRASTPSVPQSPIGVLDAACLSYKTDDTAVGSCANSSHNTPDTKRRKLNRLFEV